MAFHVVPELTVFQTPPDPTATYHSFSFSGFIAIRSCGYKMEYKIDNIIIENDNSNWIEDSVIEIRNVNDEISHHVKIYH